MNRFPAKVRPPRGRGRPAGEAAGPAATAGGPAGQATLEWIGLVLLVALLFSALVLAGPARPGPALAHTVLRKMLCAVSLATGCDRTPRPAGSYGAELAAAVRRYAPDLHFGPGLLGLPVDYRTCRSPWCAEAGGDGLVEASTAGEPVTLFTRVLDCREGRPAEPGERRPGPAPDCSGERAGRLYITYWAYWPESASLRGVPVLQRKGFHRNDWESFGVRVDPDGHVWQRASSHQGYNHTRSAINWAADAGWGTLRRAAERAGLRSPGGWGEATGNWLIAGGSHAGNVAERGRGNYPAWTPASRLRLIPLEPARHGPLARPARFDPITPPWGKDVWLDPASESTG